MSGVASTINNAGTLSVDTFDENNMVAGTFNNRGTLTVESGDLRVNGPSR